MQQKDPTSSSSYNCSQKFSKDNTFIYFQTTVILTTEKNQDVLQAVSEIVSFLSDLPLVHGWCSFLELKIDAESLKEPKRSINGVPGEQISNARHTIKLLISWAHLTKLQLRLDFVLVSWYIRSELGDNSLYVFRHSFQSWHQILHLTSSTRQLGFVSAVIDQSSYSVPAVRKAAKGLLEWDWYVALVTAVFN